MDTLVRFWRRILRPMTAILLVLACLNGCVTASSDEQWQPVVRRNGNQVHVVKWQDETLPAIVAWYTGSSGYVEAIVNANPTLDPTCLRLGDHIFIPHELLKTRADMSREYLVRFIEPPLAVSPSRVPVAPVELRVIKPVSQKSKKGGDVAAVAGEPSGEVVSSSPPPESVAKPAAEDGLGLHLFGPK